MDVTPTAADARSYRLRVSFGLHTFTKTLEPSHAPDLMVRDGSDRRCFCVERYLLSKTLPALIQAAATGKAYFSHDGNYVILERTMSDGSVVPYAAFFDIRRSQEKRTHDAVMFVKSAYLKPSLPKNMDAIRFATLVAKIARGETVSRPKPPR